MTKNLDKALKILEPAMAKDDANSICMYANIVMHNKLVQYMKGAMAQIGRCMQKGNNHCTYIAAVSLVHAHAESELTPMTGSDSRIFKSVEEFLSDGVRSFSPRSRSLVK